MVIAESVAIMVVVHSILLSSLQLCHHTEERHIQHVCWRSARSLRQPWWTCPWDVDRGTDTRSAAYWSSHRREQLVWWV